MANTYTQIYIHIVFAVKGRQCLIQREWKDELFKYMTGIIKNKNQIPIQINGMPDHVHILTAINLINNLSAIVRDIKANSSKWINEKKNIDTQFRWQNGYGAFSVSHSKLPKIINYIKNQEKHHSKKTSKPNLLSSLKRTR